MTICIQTAKHQSLCCVALAMTLFGAPVKAVELTKLEAKTLFNQLGCNACHGVDEARLGPSFQQVALRYAGPDRDGVTQRLILKIRHGGSGAWGVTPMISYPDISYQEAERIVNWIFSL